jgi:hypothetical protein
LKADYADEQIVPATGIPFDIRPFLIAHTEYGYEKYNNS